MDELKAMAQLVATMVGKIPAKASLAELFLKEKVQEVDLEKETNQRRDLFYLAPGYRAHSFNTTRDEGYIALTATHFQPAISTLLAACTPESGLMCLEVGAGNGYNSKILHDALVEASKERKIEVKYVATDLYEHPCRGLAVLPDLPSDKAVEKFGADSDILILMSPPNGIYMDYYAIFPFQAQSKRPRFLLFVGELGAADGGLGMHYFLLGPKSQWTLVSRTLVEKHTDIFGGDCEKEALLFRLT